MMETWVTPSLQNHVVRVKSQLVNAYDQCNLYADQKYIHLVFEVMPVIAGQDLSRKGQCVLAIVHLRNDVISSVQKCGLPWSKSLKISH